MWKKTVNQVNMAIKIVFVMTVNVLILSILNKGFV